MIDCKVASTPIETTPTWSTPSIDVFSDPTPYRSLVSALQYATFTRPDITFVFNRVCQFMHKPSSTHFVVAKCILQYLKGTLDKGVLFQPGPLALTAFIDVAWAGDPSDRRSTFDIVVFFCATELAWIRQVLCDLGLYLPSAPLIWCDNTSALALASNPVFHGCTKHIEVDYHFFHKRVVHGDLSLQFISTDDQFADFFTKALPSPRFH
uniref:Reverse transcriptase Ty1/copia-type domain-containing protein n=1 Tax=Fagus sylvatica TaxID=28930 RepID=A0A2N9EVX1_FAGSY